MMPAVELRMPVQIARKLIRSARPGAWHISLRITQGTDQNDFFKAGTETG
jgi:hypothetical protein